MSEKPGGTHPLQADLLFQELRPGLSYSQEPPVEGSYWPIQLGVMNTLKISPEATV